MKKIKCRTHQLFNKQWSCYATVNGVDKYFLGSDPTEAKTKMENFLLGLAMEAIHVDQLQK